jgi:hypothetical protein
MPDHHRRLPAENDAKNRGFRNALLEPQCRPAACQWCQTQSYLRIGQRYLRMKAMDTRLRARRARFGVPRKERSDRGKSRLPSKVNAIIETAIKKIYLTTETARCRGCHRGSPA